LSSRTIFAWWDCLPTSFVDKRIADAILFQPLDAIERPLLKAGVSAWGEQGRAR
jgi:hypothetical protein